MVIAGAGSGKSLTIVGKIRYLIEHKNINENEILCISFTRDASNNLKNNIIKNYGYNIEVYTFHKLALNILDQKYLVAPNDYLDYIVNEYFYIVQCNNEIKLKIKKVLCMIDTPYEKILRCNELIQLKKLIITFINLFKTNNYSIDTFLNIKKDKDLILLIIDIYYLYEEELKSSNMIDFNDMIVKAINNLDKVNIFKYKYIIVDEYQDTSYIRYLLLRKLIDKTGANIMCVGDDYQSIYRFNGCNLNIFLNFKKYFKGSKILKINNTYRNSQELINVAGSFIMKNKNQLYKKLKSNKKNNKPIKILKSNSLCKLLDIALLSHKEILILGRNTFDINKYFRLIDGCIDYKSYQIKYLTIHASKGLEAECVILINLEDGILGMPNKIKNNKILNYVNPNIDNFPYEEERRLFYVALTRTKTDVYMLVNNGKQSIFVKEILKDYSKYVEFIK